VPAIPVITLLFLPRPTWSISAIDLRFAILFTSYCAVGFAWRFFCPRDKYQKKAFEV
jgi:hypothetical protein